MVIVPVRPLWLGLARMLKATAPVPLPLAALVILAAAGPIWNPQAGATNSSAPLVILLDDGWSAASSWDIRVKAADELIANADNDRRGIALVPLSEPARDITLMPGGTARVALRQLAPKPYSIERVETLSALPTDDPIDLAFIDADKPAYPVYYEEIVTRLRPNGVILVDNTLQGGRIVDQPLNQPGLRPSDSRLQLVDPWRIDGHNHGGWQTGAIFNYFTGAPITCDPTSERE